MKALLVSQKMLKSIWPMVSDILQSAVSLFDGYILEDVLDRLKDGRYLLFVAAEDKTIHAALVLQVIDYPQKKTCHVHLVAGKGVNNWIGLMADIEEFANAMGCEDIEFIGRHGWSKLIPEFDSPARLYRKALR